MAKANDEFHFHESASCWLMEMELISLVLEPVLVEEQPVARTTITLSMTINSAERLMISQSTGTTVSRQKLPLERYAVLTM
jgi:hypothetical protein